MVTTGRQGSLVPSLSDRLATGLGWIPMKGLRWIVAASLLSGCANHPVDCAMGFHHSDCLPGTAGYDNPDKFADVDDKQCKSYGLTYGTPEYADCRLRLSAQHQGVEPTAGVIVTAPVK